jgi:hypothetical protein
MDDIVQMAIVESIGHLKSVLGGTVFIETTIRIIFQVLVKFTLRCQLKCNIDSFLVVEPGVESKNMGMPEKDKK